MTICRPRTGDRDDRLRQVSLEQLERRGQAERIAREDYEARQVLVTVEEKEHPVGATTSIDGSP
jgi:hypothetical protein